jgi:hypothetical protein
MYAPCEIAAPSTDEPEAPFALIPLRDRVGKLVAWAVIDAEDEELLGAHRWYRDPRGYAVRQVRVRPGRDGQSSEKMHRVVLGLAPGDGVLSDHVNRNRLDNRRANLRRCNYAENAQNRKVKRATSSRFRGVTWNEKVGKWRAQVWFEKTPYYLGYFPTEQEAGDAAAAKRRELMPFAID